MYEKLLIGYIHIFNGTSDVLAFLMLINELKKLTINEQSFKHLNHGIVYYFLYMNSLLYGVALLYNNSVDWCQLFHLRNLLLSEYPKGQASKGTALFWESGRGSFAFKDTHKKHDILSDLFVCSGEDGRLAYEQLDTVPREMVRLGTRRGNAVTTSF